MFYSRLKTKLNKVLKTVFFFVLFSGKALLPSPPKNLVTRPLKKGRMFLKKSNDNFLMIKRSNVDGFSKRENFVENSLSLQSTESPCSLLSIGTFRSKFSRKSSTIDFCRLKLLGLELLGLYTRNCNKFLRLIFYAYVCQRALIFFLY